MLTTWSCPKRPPDSALVIEGESEALADAIPERIYERVGAEGAEVGSFLVEAELAETES
jgi:hypothetical protein